MIFWLERKKKSDVPCAEYITKVYTKLILCFTDFPGHIFAECQNKPISGPYQRSEWPHDLSKHSNVLLSDFLWFVVTLFVVL